MKVFCADQARVVREFYARAREFGRRRPGVMKKIGLFGSHATDTYGEVCKKLDEAEKFPFPSNRPAHL